MFVVARICVALDNMLVAAHPKGLAYSRIPDKRE